MNRAVKSPPAPDRNCALFLDIDGTLLDIAPFPWDVRLPPGLSETLARLHEFLGGAVALVSGRGIADIDRIFAPLRLPAAGQHGGELRFAADGAVETGIRPSRLAEFEPKLAEFLRRHPDIVIETKGLGVAIHYRTAPHEEGAIRQFLGEALGTAADGLMVLEGKKVFEIKAGFTNKGAAVARFMERPPFAGRRPFFIGDDVTDEDGFAAVSRLGGHAIRIGAGPGSLAEAHLLSPAALRAWLTEISAEMDLPQK